MRLKIYRLLNYQRLNYYFTAKKLLQISLNWTVKSDLLHTVGLPNSGAHSQKTPESKLRKVVSLKETKFSILSHQAEK